MTANDLIFSKSFAVYVNMLIEKFSEIIMHNKKGLKIMIEANVQNEIKKSKVITNMVLMLMGRLVSLFGTKIYNFAIGLYVLKLSESGLQFSITILCGTIPRILISPIAGVVTDKVDKKKMVVIMDILSGITILGLFVVANYTQLRLGYIYGTTIIMSIFNTLFDIPMRSAIPNIVDDNNILRINALNRTISSIAMIAGPPLGGIIFALVDIKSFLLINGVSFILSAITEMFIDFNLNRKQEIEEIRKVFKMYTQGLLAHGTNRPTKVKIQLYNTHTPKCRFVHG